jgi:hypothetical protein
VSTFPKLEGLYHYMLANRADLDDCVIVALDARPANDVDFDADQGAVLVIPTGVRECFSVDQAEVQRIASASDQTR